MSGRISPELEQRLQRLARERGCSLDDLLADAAERLERSPIPGDPSRFVEVSVALICMTDLDGNLLYVNPTFCHTLGYTDAELLGQPYYTFMHPDDVAATQAAHRVVTAGSPVTQFENRYRCADGSYRWLSWAVTTGSQHVYAVALDVTDKKQTESRLAQTLEQNERILSTIFDGYLLGAVDGTIVEVNAAYCDMIGYSRDDLLQMKIFDLDAAIPHEQIAQNAQRIVSDDIPMIIETQHRHKDGHLIDVEINNIQLRDGQIACFIRDITARKRLEGQLQHSEQLYRGLVESQIDLVCRYTPETILTYVNDAYCRYFNQTRQELIGNSFLILGPGNQLQAIHDRIAAVMRNPTPDVRVFHTVEANGSRRWIQWIDYGITDETGAVVEIQAIGRDITAMMESQHKLAVREEMLSTIFRNIPVMLAQFDPQGQFEYVNQHWIDVLGWTIEEMRAHPDIMAEFYPDPDYRQWALDYMLSGEPGWRDFRTRTRDGTIIDTSWANVRLSDGRSLGIGQVITHRIELENQRVYARQLEIQLEKERELRELKDRFISLVSHEFRNPLAIMTTSVDLLLRYADHMSSEQMNQKLLTIHEQIRRVVELMEDILRFNKAEAGKTEFKPQTIQMRPFCENIINNFRLIDNDRHQIKMQVADGVLYADPKLLDHILSNLLSNALKYSVDGTTIQLNASQSDVVWRLTIADSGIGIPEDDIDHLFDPFFRADNAHDLPGTGLGLSIVKDYVDLHGGGIEVDSTVGQGTTVIITLPGQPSPQGTAETRLAT